jgi:hypothetical protein
LFTARQETAYYRGEAAAAKSAAKPEAEAPKPYAPNLEFLKTELERGPEAGAAALAKIIEEAVDHRVKAATTEVETKVDGKLTESQRRSQIESSLKSEAAEVQKDYGDLIAADKDFDAAAFAYAQDLATRAGMPVLTSGPNAGSRAIGPGMMRAAADAVYGRWAREGKLKPKAPEAPATRSLKEVISNVSSDKLGTAGAQRNGTKNGGTPKSLEDMLGIGYFKSDREVQATRNLCKRNGWDEGRWVANTLAAIRNGEIDVN